MEESTPARTRQNAPGARQTPGVAVGRSLLPSPEEWAVRNQVLASTLMALHNEYAPDVTGRALEIGCQWGLLLDSMSTMTQQTLVGSRSRCRSAPIQARLGIGHRHRGQSAVS